MANGYELSLTRNAVTVRVTIGLAFFGNVYRIPKRPANKQEALVWPIVIASLKLSNKNKDAC